MLKGLFSKAITIGAEYIFGADSSITTGARNLFAPDGFGTRLSANLAESFLGGTEEGSVKRTPFPTQDMASLSSQSRVATPRIQASKTQAQNYGYTGKVLDKFYNSGALQSKNPAIRANVDYISQTIRPTGPRRVG